MPKFKDRDYVLFFFLMWNWPREVLDKKLAEWKKFRITVTFLTTFHLPLGVCHSFSDPKYHQEKRRRYLPVYFMAPITLNCWGGVKTVLKNYLLLEAFFRVGNDLINSFSVVIL